jgi:hypothetical protein
MRPIAPQSLRQEGYLLLDDSLRQLQTQTSCPKQSFYSKIVRHSQTLEIEPCEQFDSLGDLAN